MYVYIYEIKKLELSFLLNLINAKKKRWHKKKYSSRFREPNSIRKHLRIDRSIETNHLKYQISYNLKATS